MRQLHLHCTTTTMLNLVRPTLTPNGLLNSLHTMQRCSVHNGTAASRTVAALLASPPTPQLSSSSSSSSPTALGEPHTHFRITLRRSGISLGKRVQGTLAALGLRRRMQTVYHSHTPEAAGMILAVKELVEVQNVPASAVRTAGQQRKERKALRGFVVVGSKREGSSASGLTL
jgi:large subunit ribosomal protein L30